MSISQSSDPTSMESQQFIPTALEVKNHPNPIPLWILMAWKISTLKISISPHSQEIGTPFSRKWGSLHPEEFQTQRTVAAYEGGEVPHQGQWSALLSCKRFSSIFYSYTSRLYYCIFLPNGKCWDITRKKDPGKLKPWLELLLMQDLKCSFFFTPMFDFIVLEEEWIHFS